MIECVHRTWISPLQAKENKGITLQQEKLLKPFLLWFLNLFINFKWFVYGEHK